MPIADELQSKDMLHGEKYDEIRAEKTDQEKMRKLFESFKAGNTVKMAFYELLEKHELTLFKELGGVCRKRKLADPESPVPCKRLNTGSNEQDNLNLNNASTSAQTPAPAYTTVYNIVNGSPPAYIMENNPKSIVPKTVLKNSLVAKKEKKPPAPKKEKAPATKKEKKLPAPKKEKKAPATKKEKKLPAPKKEKKGPATKKEKKAPATKKEKKAPATKKEKKAPAPKKEKKLPAPKKEKKGPATKKVKKALAPKKVKKPAGRK
ncbi:histone H1-like isoform X2 [Chanodichthys erythropterus]